MNGSSQSMQVSDSQRRSQKRGDCDVAEASTARAVPPGAKPAQVHDDVSTAHMGWLVHTIEDEIVPRLIRTARGGSSAQVFEIANQARKHAAVRELAKRILDNHAGAAAEYIEELRAQGLSLETIYLDVMSPAARHLGVLWEEDTVDFTAVTVGLWRLQQLMYALSPEFHDDDARGVHVQRALLVPVPGSQHTLGLLMVAEFFRRAGWDVWGDPVATAEDLVREVKAQVFDLAGFSVGSETHFPVLTGVIKRVRAASVNPAICVMVGGPVIVANPGLVNTLGADGTAPDAAHAVQVAGSLVQAHRAAQQRSG
jgi:methanogenic corrinoid protein MtbC1